MKKYLQSIAVLTLVSSCGVPQSDYDHILAENENLKDVIRTLQSERDLLLSEKLELEEKKRLASMYTEADALRLIKDYYDFYNADMVYRKPRVRRVSHNVFRISLEECTNKKEFRNNSFFWQPSVKRLTIHEDGKYDVIGEMH